MVNPSKRFFADGITEDIITALSRYPSLFVIARSSSFSFKGRAIDVKQVRRELGVRYVIEGSVRKAGNHIRVTAQLDGRGDRNSYSLGDLVLHGEDVDEIPVVVLGPDVATDLGFDGRYESQRGTSMCGPPISAACGISSKLLATTTFSRGSTFSTPFPNFAGVYRGLAMACIQAVTDFRAQTPTEAHSAAESSARWAIALDPADAAAHSTLAAATLYSRGDYESALAEAERALALCPNLASAHGILAQTLIFSGRPREGLVALERSIRLAPHNPMAHIRFNLAAMGSYFSRQYDAAAEVAKRAVRSYPEYPLPYRWLAAALGQLGRTAEAREALDKAMAVSPALFDVYVRQRMPWHRPEDYAHMLEGLRQAGWEG